MRQHRTDGVSLVFGLIFLLVAVGWLVSQLVDVKVAALGWVAAVALIVVGGLGLLAALRKPGEPDPVEPAPIEPPAAVETDVSEPDAEAGDSLNQ